MKTIKLMPLLTAAMLVVLLASCGPAYVSTGAGYGPGYYGARPYGYNYGYGYRPYGYYRPPVIVNRPPVVVRPRYYSPSPRNYGGGAPRARGGYGGGYNGGGRSRGPR
ncbi:hypothetical protein [Spirosoma validum]|nr:hypothetical protein [Spirosoma validum]